MGPYLSTYANVHTTKTRGMCYFPYEMMQPNLDTDLTAQRVFELIVSVLVYAGLEATCGDLINFLTIALVYPSLTWKEPWTLQYQARKAGYVPGPMATSYQPEKLRVRGATVATNSEPWYLRQKLTALNPVLINQPANILSFCAATLWT
jgi:hypothetical protein